MSDRLRAHARRVAHVARHPISRNAMALYWAQAATFVLPFLLLPYLSRVVGSSAFGLVVLAQSLYTLLGLFVDYGFDASAPRDIAAARQDPTRLARVVADVVGARLILVTASVAAAGIAYVVVPELHDHPVYLVFALVTAVTTGFSPGFVFIGIERLPRIAYVQLATRAVSTALVFPLVHGAGEAWRVVALTAAGSTAGCLVTTWMMYRHVPRAAFRLKGSLQAVRGSTTLFAGITGASMYTSANVVLLGIFSSSSAVAYFAAAEKIVRALLQLLGPMADVIYPRFARLIAAGEDARARRLAFISIGVLGGVGLAAAIGLIALAPLIIDIVYGHAFHSSVGLLRILALILVAQGLSTTFSGGWMLALRLDRRVLQVVVTAAVVNVVLGVVLVNLLGSAGMAIAVVCAETSLLVSCLVIVRRNERRKDVPVLLTGALSKLLARSGVGPTVARAVGRSGG